MPTGSHVEPKSLRALDLAAMACADLSARPLRTILTTATFATSLIVAIVLIAAGTGLHSAVSDMLRDLGEGQISATPGRTTGVGGVRRSGRPIRIRYRDLAALARSFPSFDGVAAYYDLRGGGASSYRYSIPWSPTRAVAAGYRDIRGIPLAEGRWFSAAEEEGGAWVTVLNFGLREMLFRDEDAVGQWIEWRGRRMQVVGVVRDEAVFPYLFFIPYETVTQMADARYISGVIARPRPSVDWNAATTELRRALAGVGGFDWRDENALEIESNHEFTREVRTLTGALHLLVLTIAGVSLVLGGAGMANMIAIGVTERTREIGLRKALGARPRDLFAQVLAESSFVIAVGAVLGVGGAVAICRAIGDVPMTERYSASIEVGTMPSAIAIGFLTAVGWAFSFLPARRCARLEPVDALRWE